MKTKKILTSTFLAVFLIGTLSLSNVSQASDWLLQQSDLEYLGAFRGPNYWGGSDCYSLAYGGGSMAYNPHNNSLYVSGIEHCNYVTEITIPTLVNSSSLGALNRASFLTPSPYYFDPTEGHRDYVGADGAAVGGSKNNRGLLVYGNKLIGTTKVYYDAGYAQRLTHFTHSLNLAQASFAGHYEFDVSIYKGILPGYLGLVSDEYQSILGGKVITGMGFGSIATATSFGPSTTVFDPDDLGTVNPVPASPLQYYNSAEHALAGYYYANSLEANPYVSPSDRVGGVAFPSGTRSILFFGSHGQSSIDGYSCYGVGVSTLEQAYSSGPPYLLENRRTDCSGGSCCYDPISASKGTHAYPYVNQVWFYDVNDWIAVKNGTKQGWENIPYTVWNPSLPTAGGQILSAAYDPRTRRIFVAQGHGDGTSPVFHVFQVAGDPDTTAPAAPGGLTVQ